MQYGEKEQLEHLCGPNCLELSLFKLKLKDICFKNVKALKIKFITTLLVLSIIVQM